MEVGGRERELKLAAWFVEKVKGDEVNKEGGCGWCWKEQRRIFIEKNLQQHLY